MRLVQSGASRIKRTVSSRDGISTRCSDRHTKRVVREMSGDTPTRFLHKLFVELKPTGCSAKTSSNNYRCAAACKRINDDATYRRGGFDKELCQACGHRSGVRDAVMLIIGLCH